MSILKKGLFSQQDMTQGSALKGLVLFAIPLLIGNIFQQFYSTVDAWVVGNYVNKEAYAAVGASGMIIFFFISLFIGISVGAGVLISQAFGAKDQVKLKKTVGTMYALTIIAGFFLMIAGILLADPLLRLMGTPAETFEDSLVYLRIIFIGIIASAAYNTFGGVLRAVGDSVTPLIFLIIATILNIVLDLLFVVVFHWGVAGVAWATIIAQAISAILSIIRINKMDDALHVRFSSIKIDPVILKDIIRIGLPAGIQQISIALGSMAIQGLVNKLGVDVIGGNVSAMRIDTFTTMPMMTVAIAVTTYVGQNIGAKRMDRVEHGTKISIFLIIAIAAVMSTTSLVFARPLLALFTPGEEGVINAGMDLLWRIAPFYFLLGIMFCISSVMRGAGESLIPMISSIMSVVVIRVPIAYLLYHIYGTPSSIWWATPIGWAMGVTFQLIYFRFSNWRVRAARRIESRDAPFIPAPE